MKLARYVDRTTLPCACASLAKRHSCAPQIKTFFDKEMLSLYSFASRDFQQNEQVCITYGTRPAADLLLYSGFIPDDFPADNDRPEEKIRIAVGMGKDALAEKRKELGERFSLPRQVDIFGVLLSCRTVF